MTLVCLLATQGLHISETALYKMSVATSDVEVSLMFPDCSLLEVSKAVDSVSVMFSISSPVVILLAYLICIRPAWARHQ